MPRPESTDPRELSVSPDAERFLHEELEDEERESLEQKILFEDEFFEEVLGAEADLLDAAVRDEIEPQGQARIAQLPELDRRLDFARQLAATARFHRPAERPPKSTAWRPWLSLAALLAVALAFGRFLLPSPEPAFVLPPSGVRGGDAELVVKGEVESLRLHLELPREQTGEAFEVELSDGEGQILERWEELSVDEMDWGRTVTVRIPKDLLLSGEPEPRSGTYHLDLRVPGAVQTVRYRFSIRWEIP